MERAATKSEAAVRARRAAATRKSLALLRSRVSRVLEVAQFE
jgi:hypothetical protein